MKISVAYIVRDEMAYMRESLAQAEKFADEIVCVVDSRSFDGTFAMLQKKAESDARYRIFMRFFDVEVNQKNFARDQCTGDWILFLDGDEVLGDNCASMRKVVEVADESGTEAISLRGHHFMGSLGFEDSWLPEHFWQNRLFRNKPGIRFKGTHHAILTGFDDNKRGLIEDIKVFHFGYARNLIRILEKWEQDMSTLEIHSKDFLEWWKMSHLLGTYPVKAYTGQVPRVILDKFKLEGVEVGK